MSAQPKELLVLPETRIPTPSKIWATRKAAGLTQTAAAALVHTTCRVWQQWEAGDRKMHAAFWELFRIKAAAQRTPAVPVLAKPKPRRERPK